jgi:hypothetical protein
MSSDRSSDSSRKDDNCLCYATQSALATLIRECPESWSAIVTRAAVGYDGFESLSTEEPAYIFVLGKVPR